MYTSNTFEQRIGGLRKNVSYRFEVVAINEKGQRSEPTYAIYFVSPYGMFRLILEFCYSFIDAIVLFFSLGFGSFPHFQSMVYFGGNYLCRDEYGEIEVMQVYTHTIQLLVLSLYRKTEKYRLNFFKIRSVSK